MKNAMETAHSMIGKIRPGYNMSHTEMAEIYEMSNDKFEAMCAAFRLGYLKGDKAAKAEVKVRLVEKPKYKNEYRTAISDNLKKIKNTMDLENLYKLTNLCISVGSDSNEDFAEEDIVLYLILNGLIREKHSLKVLRNIHTLVNSYTRAAEGRMQG